MTARWFLALFLAGCGSSSSVVSTGGFCVGKCELLPIAPLPEHCTDKSPKYAADGTPTPCYYYPELNRVAVLVKACAKKPGIVATQYHFDADGSTRSVRAIVDCEQCRMPEFVEREPFLRCVEQAAAAARLPLAPGHAEFRVAFLYRVGDLDDPRLDLGWQPLDGASNVD